jgi:hypothetical protein
MAPSNREGASSSSDRITGKEAIQKLLETGEITLQDLEKIVA